jgi:3-deoxy-D-manno-octulosonate 8-phosphate phosphatase KdsC-like HAD superfamily phosphatase
MIDKATKQPLLNEDGTPVTLEDYVGNPSITAQALRAIPSFGLTSKIADVGIGNLRKQVETLKENWLTANLRKESGAVIGEEEFAREDRKYFPQIGDSFEVRNLKKQLRQQAEQGMLLESGKGGTREATQFGGFSIKKVGN